MKNTTNKIIKFLVLLIVTFTLLFYNYKKVESSSILNSYAYQISLIKYTGSGSTKSLGKMLVYNPRLFDEYVTKRGSAPGSYEALCSGDGVYQLPVSEKNPYGSMAPTKESMLGDNKALKYDKYGNASYQITTCNSVSASDKLSKDPESGITDWFETVFSYMSNERTITWKAPSTGEWHTAIADSNLTENSVTNQNYLDTLFDRYASTKDKIKRYFGVTLDYKEMEQYYIEFVPIERVEGSYSETSSYVANTFFQVRLERDEWDASTWTGPYNCQCQTCYSSTCWTEKCTTGEYKGKYHCGSSYKCGAYDCNCKKCYSLPTQLCGIRNRHIVYGKYAVGSTYLRVVTSGSKLNRAINLCSETKNKHCVLDENNNCTNVYQYYVGPSLEKALVGTEKYNKYKLKGSCTTQSPTKGKKDYYLITDWKDDCQRTCQVTGSNKSDEYLKCAENYCDAEVDFDLKGNARIRKKNCILSCGYTYGKDPDTGSETSPKRESVDSCGNSNPYKNKDKYVSNSESTCSTSNTKYVPMREEKAVITSCQGDNVTDFDNNDTNDTIFDLRTYINIACKEESSFDFLDTSKLYLTAGQGIEYLTQLLGERECTVYFNLEQWKFDYASISAKDPDRRKRLNYVYTVFNNILDESYDKTKNKYYDPDFLAEHMGEVDWDTGQFIYNKDKVSVRSKVTEIINNKVEEKATEELKNTNYTTKTNQNVWFKNSSDKNKSKVTKITKMKLTQDSVNKYISTSKVEAEYMFKDSCVTTDGESKVYSPTSGVCYELKTGETTKKILPKNVYYTSLMATPNSKFNETIIKQKKTHNIETNTSVGRDIKEEQVYYDNKEKCEYKIQDQNLMCKIVIDSTGATKLGNDIYEGESVTAKVWAEEELEKDDGIESVSITVNGKTYDGNSRNISIEKATDSNEKFEIEGTVITKKGAVVNCPKTIHILRHPPSCGVSCSINKINDKLYEIVSTGRTTPTNYYRSLSTNMTKVEVFPSFADKKYYVRLDSSLEDVTTRHIYNANILFGYVYSSRCNDYCRTPFNDLPDCEEKYKASKTGDIREYCETYYQDDINNYESVEDCVIRCSSVRECPENRRDIKEVTSFCQANYSKAGYKDADLCVNRCYYCPECDSSEYVFRPISNSDPFPNSEESVIPGNRLIGKNWYSLSKYITKDDEDHTSVTGDFANMNVEYIIDLNPQKIKKIRLDSLEKGVSIYSAYVYTSTTEKNAVTRYKSSFIHEDFKEYFKDSLVSGGKTIIALPDE